MPETPDAVKSLLVQALDLSPDDRAALLAAADPAVRAEVEALLAAHDGAGGFLGGPADPPTQAWGEPPTPEPWSPAAGGVLAGRYKLVEPVGEGGMGAVWAAQQTEPVRRRVAVKLIRVGMDSRAVLARFEAERQALALMDHPNIARVLDAGTAADGRPFFVMELVKGVPITDFCDERRLTPRERLALFVPVCRAIQHAHQKGIIHRDIKPSNVLVALYDDRPVPKVIDFGVAKATGEPLTDKTINTGLAAVVGTPAYMAPEQATLNNLDVDTRADVYGLGALLYELLAGSPPFARDELYKAGMLEMLRVIREDEPPRPSARVSTAAGRPSIAAVRGTDPGALAGLLRSELDWVVMKALDKDRVRRYETAAGFAADVERFLAGEPVTAAPPGGLYRLRKFVRRNRGAVLAVGLLLLAAAVGAAGLVRSEMVKATAARQKAADAQDAADKAGRLTKLLQRLLESADPNAAGGPEGTVGRMLDRHAPALWDELADQKMVEASLRTTVGRVYFGLIDVRKSEAHLQRAIELYRAADPDDPRLAAALTDLALNFNETPSDVEFTTAERQPRIARGVAAAREAVDILRRGGRGPSEELARAMLTLALVRWNDTREANFDWLPAAIEEAMSVARPLPGDGPKRVLARGHELLSNYLRDKKQYPKSTEHAEKAYALRLAVEGEGHMTTARAHLILGACYAATEHWPRANASYQASLAGFDKVFGDRPNPYSTNALWDYLICLAGQHRDEAAEEVLTARPPAWNAPDFRFPDGDQAAFLWGEVCLERCDFAAAERLFRAAMTAQPAAGLYTTDRAYDYRISLAVALVGQGRMGEARALLREDIAAARRVADGGPPGPAGFLKNLYMKPARLMLFAAFTDPVDGPPALKLFERFRASVADDPDLRPFPRLMELFTHHRLGDYRAATAGEFVRLTEWDGLGRLDRVAVERVLVDAHERLGELPTAERLLRQYLADSEKRDGKGHPEVATRQTLLATFLARNGRTAEAVEPYQAAYRLLSAHPAAAGKSLANRRADLAGRLAALFPADSADASHWQAERAKLPPGPVAIWGATAWPWLMSHTSPADRPKS